MRITNLEISPLDLTLETALTVAYGSYPVLNYALLKIVTDEGLIGLGEASPDPEVTGETQETVLDALERARPLLVDADPLQVEPLLRRCRAAIPAFPAALAAIDMALYDLLGQALGAPVHQLLGGLARPAIGLYPVIPLDEPPVMAVMSARFVEMGAQILKVKLGSSPDLDLLRLNEIRAAVGDSVLLRLDINQGWRDAETTLSVLRRLDGFNIEWIEQPVLAADLTGLAAVAAATDIPIMADESCHTAADALKIACLGAADMLNIKLMKCGGLSEARKLLAVAESAGLPCILGSMGESSIGSAAGLHFAAAHPSIVACEVIGPLFITNDPAAGYQVEMSTFQAQVSTAPGLGVTLK
ncbi:MAG: dipeptide epimerase [Anaerolineales bacterium]|nr:dipeptide epimerase [Anaerolineales bacterium]MCX7754016.1 dipeptide epimerase [Anaerolineales bacterium]MDW8276778.1 dipeptide epimerase [Anaerolineales bacterium]